MRRLPTLIAVLAVAVAVSACGEKDESAATEAQVTQTTAGGGGGGAGGDTGGGGATDKAEQIATAVTAVIGGNDPKQVCEEFATVVYVKHSYGDAQGCRAAVEKRQVVEVDLTIGPIEASTAKATATPKGGPNKGENLKVDLVNEGGVWKVDVVRSNAPVGP